MTSIKHLSLISLTSLGCALNMQAQINWITTGPDKLWSNSANWQGSNIPDTNSESARFAASTADDITVDGNYTIKSYLDGFAGPNITHGLVGSGVLTVDFNSSTGGIGIDNATGNAGGILRFNNNVVISNSGGGVTNIRNTNSDGNILLFDTGSTLTLNTLLQTVQTTNASSSSIQFNGTFASSAANLQINSGNVSFGAGHNSTAFGADIVMMNNSLITIDGGTVLNVGRKFQVNGASAQLILNGANTINSANITVAGSNALTLAVNADQANMGMLVAPGALTINLDPSVNVLAFIDSAAQEWGLGTVSISGFRENVIRFGIDANGLSAGQLAAIDGGTYLLSNDGYLTAVPEPSTYALLFGALALGFIAVRRRR